MLNTLQSDISHSEPIGLAELIEKVKDELRTLPKSDQVFLVDKVELEIHVAVEKKAKKDDQGIVEGKAELKLNVLNWDFLNLGKAEIIGKTSGSTAKELNRQDIHTIKLTLVPAYKDKNFMDKLSPEKKTALFKPLKKVFFEESQHLYVRTNFKLINRKIKNRLIVQWLHLRLS